MLRNLLLLLVFSLPIHAATVIGSLKDVSGNPINSQVKFAPDGLPAITVDSLAVGVSKTVTPVNGSFTVDLVNGIYSVTVQNQPTFKIFVPTAPGTYNITDLATGLVLSQSSTGSKVSTNDTTVGYLAEKIVQGTNTLLETINFGGNEKLRINSIGGGGGGTNGGIASVGFAAPDIFTVTGSPLTANGTITLGVTDPGGDRVMGWDDSSGKLIHFQPTQGIVLQGNVLTLDVPGLPTLSTPNPTMGYVIVYDVSSGNNTKMLMQNFPGLHTLTLTFPTNLLTLSGIPATNINSTVVATLTPQAANTGFFGPAAGPPVEPTFRGLVPADIPNLDAAKITTGKFPIARVASGTPNGTQFVRDDGTLAVPPGGGGGGGTPGGSDSQVQVNVGGAFSGSASLRFTNSILSAANATITSNLVLSATGGSGHYLKQTNAAGPVISGAIAAGDIPTAVDAAKIADGSVSNAKYQNLADTTGPIQAGLNSKLTIPADPNTNGLLGWRDSAGTNDYFIVSAPLQLSVTNLGLNLGSELDVIGGALGWKDGQPLAADYITNLQYQVFTHSSGMTNIGAGVSGIYFKTDGNLYSTNATAGEKNISRKKIPLGVFFSDRTTPITTGTNKARIRVPCTFTVTEVRASLTTAQVSGNILVIDINENGTSILSTKLSIDNGEKTSTTAAAPPVISDTSLADDAEITIDVDQVGNGTAIEGMVWIIGYES